MLLRKVKYEENPKFLNDFLNYCIAIKNFSNDYIANINSTCKQFLFFINNLNTNQFSNINEMDINCIRKLSKEEIYEFVYYLGEKNYKPDSILTKIHELQSFLNYLYESNYHLFQNPTKELKSLNLKRNKDKKIPNVLSVDECKILLKSTLNSKDKNNIRDYTILTLFLNTGIRLSELISIDINKIDFIDKKIIVFGKGKKERTIYLTNSSIDSLKKYLKVRGEEKHQEKALFISNKNNRMSSCTVENVLKKRLQEANINFEKYSIHSLRHTFATFLSKDGVDLKIIQTILGHSNIDTTKIYTKIFDKEVKNIMNMSPLANTKISDLIKNKE